jgi:hypothetical protein
MKVIASMHFAAARCHQKAQLAVTADHLAMEILLKGHRRVGKIALVVTEIVGTARRTLLRNSSSLKDSSRLLYLEAVAIEIAPRGTLPLLGLHMKMAPPCTDLAMTRVSSTQVSYLLQASTKMLFCLKHRPRGLMLASREPKIPI